MCVLLFCVFMYLVIRDEHHTTTTANRCYIVHFMLKLLCWPTTCFSFASPVIFGIISFLRSLYQKSFSLFIFFSLRFRLSVDHGIVDFSFSKQIASHNQFTQLLTRWKCEFQTFADRVKSTKTETLCTILFNGQRSLFFRSCCCSRFIWPQIAFCLFQLKKWAK